MEKVKKEIEKYEELKKYVEKANYGNGCKPYIRTFLDINDDDKHELILTCAKYSVQEPEDMLFQLNKEKFDLLISNQ